MGLQVPVVWSEDCLRHEPGGEVWLGVRDPGTEVPARAVVLRDALAAAGAPIVPANRHGDEILRAVHDPLLLEHPGGSWAGREGGAPPGGVRPGPRRPLRVPAPRDARRAADALAAGRARPGRPVLLRHDDAGRPGQVGG